MPIFRITETRFNIFLNISLLQIIRPLKFPWVKFVIHTTTYIAFLVMIVASTVETSMLWESRNSTVSANYPSIFAKYDAIRNNTNSYHYGRDIPIRQTYPTTSQMLITIWVVGNVQLLSNLQSFHCENIILKAKVKKKKKKKKKKKRNKKTEAYNSTKADMSLEMSYRGKVPSHRLADSNSDWHLCVCITLAAN